MSENLWKAHFAALKGECIYRKKKVYIYFSLFRIHIRDTIYAEHLYGKEIKKNHNR
jgi:hypothetical protein